ncbi:restriction endonuclease subunit S [Lactiplantibacillus pentosus]|uniref:restriction endonuclease subunit S n=1 Tax=Lactiplantibacillus pentosus TaxID=1589 RepID=UPI0021A4A413|nr:restriction endonuclease subunit S [Lactiplantibacillus pentosus]MCT3329128.1 restriction endonuclease subunit S [Lactiplantibacillus pentosus]
MAKIDDSVKKKVPELRFPGFTDDWEERKLADFIDVKSGKDYKHLNSGSIPVYGTGGYMLSVDRALSDIDAIGIGRKGTIDKPYLLKAPFWTVDTLFYAVPKQNIDLQFSLSIFKKINWKKFDESTGVPSLSKTVINSVGASVPSYEEQQKIGSFFQQLDETIALHQRKLDLLKEQKKGYLQKMFPKNGAKVPELRFAGFADAWEDRKFFESIASTIDFRGRTPKKLGMDWSESGYLALSALNVKNGYIDPLADAHYGDENLYKKWMSGKELKKGQVLFTTEAPMGNVAQVPDNNGYILSQRTVAFETKEDMMTNDFLAVLLKSPLVFNNLSALSSGGTAKGVSQKSLKGLSITVPFDIDEQQKIGSFFKQLDDTIALHQRKLDLLKEQKKGFLQKMFV